MGGGWLLGRSVGVVVFPDLCDVTRGTVESACDCGIRLMSVLFQVDYL